MEKERIESEIETESAEVMLPGFRFHPTDEELVGFYLRRKILHKPLSVELIKQLDIYKYDPWDLPKMATTGEKEWYFYCPRDRKYRNSARPNRVTGAGFWKATGTDRPIYSSDGSKCIGLKKSLVFYRGRAAKGSKTDWMMHEFRLPPAFPKKHFDKTIPPNEAWAICRIFKKASSNNAQRALSQSWISSPFSDNNTTNSDHTIINPTTSITYTTTSTSSLPLSFCGDSSMAATFSLLNYQQPNSVYDASSLLLDMSTSVLGECVDFRGLPEPCSEPSAALEAAEMVRENVGNVREVDGEWGMIRFPNYSNLVWDYSSPCLSELSTAYSTSNCYT